MKNIYPFAMLLIFILTLTGCHNDDDSPMDPIDLLPPATQTGEETFGFLKNGEPVAVYNTWKMRAHIVGGALDFGAGGGYI